MESVSQEGAEQVRCLAAARARLEGLGVGDVRMRCDPDDPRSLWLTVDRGEAGDAGRASALFLGAVVFAVFVFGHGYDVLGGASTDVGVGLLLEGLAAVGGLAWSCAYLVEARSCVVYHFRHGMLSVTTEGSLFAPPPSSRLCLRDVVHFAVRDEVAGSADGSKGPDRASAPVESSLVAALPDGTTVVLQREAATEGRARLDVVEDLLNRARGGEVAPVAAEPAGRSRPEVHRPPPVPPLSPSSVPGLAEAPPAGSPRCGFCSDAVALAWAVRCPRCETPHHAPCWGENGGCTVFGCLTDEEAKAARLAPAGKKG